MSRIFITYRREDTSSQAGRVFDRLSEYYGKEAVFKDVDSIDPGRPWRQAIENAVSGADVVLALIGPRWLEELEQRAEGDDYVRYELETALVNDRRVIPLLVNGAAMPTPDRLPARLEGLTERQAFDVSDTRFRSDMEELIRRLDRVVERPGQAGGNGQADAPAPAPTPAPAGDDAALETELAKWNWGAFLLTFVWGMGHGVMRAWLVWVPNYGIYEWVMLGLKGNRWAWEKRRWDSVEQFRQTQRKWAVAGIIVSVLFFILLIAYG